MDGRLREITSWDPRTPIRKAHRAVGRRACAVGAAPEREAVRKDAANGFVFRGCGGRRQGLRGVRCAAGRG